MVTNNNGKQIIKRTLNTAEGTYILPEQLASGVYYFTLYNKDKALATKKVIIK